MRNMKRILLVPARNRLRDEHGFMLAEQLMSVMFLGFLSLVIAAGFAECVGVGVRDAGSHLLRRVVIEE